VKRAFLLLALFVAPPASAEPAKFMAYLAPEAYHSSLFFTDKLRTRPRAGLQVVLPDGIVLLGELSGESLPYGPDTLGRVEFSVGAGYPLTDRLVAAVLLSAQHSSYANFDRASSGGGGAQLRYDFPIGHDTRFRVLTLAGFQYFEKVTLTHTTTVGPASPAARAICTFFTLGLADCSTTTTTTYASFPAERQWFLAAGIGYAF
jgi:hypothetical protein